VMEVSNWAKRPGRGKWHLVESIIAGDAVTHCGRRLSDEGGLLVSQVQPLTRAIDQPQLCKRCA